MIVDPPRLFDGDANEFERALLGSALGDIGSSTAEARSIAAVAAVLTVASAATAASGAAGTVATVTASAKAGAASAPFTAGVLAKWLGVGVVAGLAAATGTHHLNSRGAPERPSASALAVRVPPPPAAAPAPRAEHAAVVPPPSVPPALSDPEPAPVAAPASSLGAELRWLDVARTALESGDPGAALEALDERDRRHPGGELGPEAALLRVEALLARGDRAAARRVARPWLSAASRGAHTERMRALLEQNP